MKKYKIISEGLLRPIEEEALMIANKAGTLGLRIAGRVWLEKKIFQVFQQAKKDEREKTIRLMQHQARNVLKSADAVADWGDVYLNSKK